MPSSFSIRLLAGIAFIAFLSGCKVADKTEVVKIGYLLCDSEKETIERFLPLTRYLTKKVGVEFALVPVEINEFEKRFKAGEFSFARTNSYIYTLLRERHGARLVASEKRGSFGSRTAGVIIARKESGIGKPADVRGKRMAFGPLLAPAGYLSEYDMLLASGIDPEKDLGHYTIPPGGFKHEKLVYGVLYGKYDVAAVPLLDLEAMIRDGKISSEDLAIVARSGLIPYCTFAAASNVDEGIVKKVRDALLSLSSEDTVELDGERSKVTKAARIDGYEELSDRDFNPVRDMAKRVNLHISKLN
jgi:ABC-type phosphate/phosphonate transport system substrate-binding protein